MQSNSGLYGISKGVNPPRSEIYVYTGNGHGSSGTCIRRFLTVGKSLGKAISYLPSATQGDSFVANEDGVYSVTYYDRYSGGAFAIGLSLNAADLTLSAVSLGGLEKLAEMQQATSQYSLVSVSLFLRAGDIIRAHTDGTPDNATAGRTGFRIVKVSS